MSSFFDALLEVAKPLLVGGWRSGLGGLNLSECCREVADSDREARLREVCEPVVREAFRDRPEIVQRLGLLSLRLQLAAPRIELRGVAQLPGPFCCGNRLGIALQFFSRADLVISFSNRSSSAIELPVHLSAVSRLVLLLRHQSAASFQPARLYGAKLRS
jgi:hypothetical protein